MNLEEKFHQLYSLLHGHTIIGIEREEYREILSELNNNFNIATEILEELEWLNILANDPQITLQHYVKHIKEDRIPLKRINNLYKISNIAFNTIQYNTPKVLYIKQKTVDEYVKNISKINSHCDIACVQIKEENVRIVSGNGCTLYFGDDVDPEIALKYRHWAFPTQPLYDIVKLMRI